MINFRVGSAPSVSVQAMALQTSKLVLRGDVVPLTGASSVVRNGRLCIEGNRIAALLGPGDALPANFAGAFEVDTQGTLYPGLIDLHNHLTYNHIPLWQLGKAYTNRNLWRMAEPEYGPNVTQPFKLLAENADVDYRRAIVRWAECRNLLGGVTTGQGMSIRGPAGIGDYFKGLMRNVEQPLGGEGPATSGQTLDFLPDEIESKLVPALAKGLPYFYHLSEGTDADARQRFLDLKRANGEWAVASNFIAIHCVALQAADYEVLHGTAGMVWSPTSNLLLYGRTADVAAAKARGVPIALGADWAPSGCRNMLGELKVARAVSEQLGGLFTAQELVASVTAVPARMVGWHGAVGTLAPGLLADVLVLRGTAADPYTHIISASESDVAAVLIDGRPRLASADLALGDPATCEPLTIGGRPYLLDLTELNNDNLGGMRLSTATAKLAYGLAHLPDLASTFQPAMAALAEGQPQAYWLEDEFSSDSARSLDFNPLALPTKALRLDHITAVDDPSFAQRMQTSPNLPEYVKAVF